MPQRYVISPWGKDSEGPCPQVVVDFRVNLGFGWLDITKQPSEEFDDGHVVLGVIEAAQAVLDQIEAHPLYKVIDVDGKVSDVEREDLSQRFKDDIDNLPPDATRKQLVEGLVAKFRQQKKQARPEPVEGVR